ncbi:hypothetical protein DERP_006147 [Dermatophagoides pteronyssinus]|uniref:Uncharacterized protein n=1 Tax=Dermatophagoides pteronyssinus TaxID=6956 RepID=A0ABQ8JT05_DERPT|nr:hypothetical protein DERP_006147 [Dermatophagoides pteronyssinus]
MNEKITKKKNKSNNNNRQKQQQQQQQNIAAMKNILNTQSIDGHNINHNNNENFDNLSTTTMITSGYNDTNDNHNIINNNNLHPDPDTMMMIYGSTNSLHNHQSYNWNDSINSDCDKNNVIKSLCNDDDEENERKD